MLKKEIKQLWKLIKKANKILLVSHIRMDADTFGSTSALYYILKAMWKEVKATNEDKAPKNFNFMKSNRIISQI